MTENNQFVTPVGRLVQGSVWALSDKGYQGKPLVDKNKVPRQECYFAVACEKTAETLAIITQIQALAAAGFPRGESRLPTFAWKIMDGDAPQYAEDEGFAGCFVFKFKGGYLPKVTRDRGTVVVTNQDEVKRGYFVRVAFSAACNGNADKPGIFLNPSAVNFEAFGPEIRGGIDTAAAFGAEAALPSGATLAPQVPQGPGAGPFAPQAPAQLGPFPPAAPLAGVAPAPSFLRPPAPGLGQAQLGTPPPAPVLAPPTGPTLTAKAGAWTLDQLLANGWTVETLRAEGLLL